MAEVEVGGVKFKGGKMFAVIMALSTFVGGLYGAFEVYKDYMDMKKKILSYTAPDMSGFDKKLAVMTETTLRAIAASSNERFDAKINRVTTTARQSEKNIRDITESASSRFDAKINGIDSKLNVFEKRQDKKLQRALDNPLLRK